jgi:tetratricopeptide (TPR) repeat protein
MALLVATPGLYIEGSRVAPGVELGDFFEPERRLSYTLSLKSPDRKVPVASYQLELNVDAEGWLSRANVLEDPVTKSRCLERALVSQPNDPEILMALGELLWKQKETSQAIDRFERVLRSQPKNIAARKALAALYSESQPNKALDIYRALADLDPDGRLDHFKQIAKLQEQLGQSPADTYRKILSLKKNDPDAIEGIEGLYAQRVKRAQQWEAKGQLEKAIREMKLALEVQSTKEAREYLAALYNNLGYDVAKRGKYKDAIRVYEKSLKWNKDPVTYLNLADACRKTKQTTKGLEALRRAYALKPKEEEVSKSILLLWGELLMVKKDYERAVQKFKELRKRFPKDTQVTKALGMAYWQKGDHDNALNVLTQLSPLLSKHSAQERAETHRLIGDLHRLIGDREKEPKVRIGHYDRALKAYEQAIALNGKDKEALRHWEEVAEERKSLKIQMLQSS